MDINPNSSKNPRDPIEAYKKLWDFLGYFRVVNWAPVGPKEVENTNRRDYLMGDSQKIPQKSQSPYKSLEKSLRIFGLKLDRYLGRSVLHRTLRKS